MYTRCPHCSTFFGVSAAQLSAAGGRVRCGNCLSIFDGLKHLSEARPESGNKAAETDSLFAPREAPEDDAGEWQEGGNEHAFDGASEDENPPTLAALDEAAEAVPEVLKEDLARAEAERRARGKNLLLTLIALILVAGLAAQYAWFKPDKVLAGYPQARPLLEKFCAFAGCVLPDRRDPAKIQMLARDVRVHPGYEGALLISATLINAAAHAQPYPRLQFSVFNVNGQTIASRVFEPEEYLSQDLNPKGDMVPGKPLQIAVELIAPEEAAISYEFSFL